MTTAHAQRCVSVRRNVGGFDPAVTIGEAVSLLEGPARREFLAHGIGSNTHVTFRVGDKAMLAKWKRWSDGRFRKAMKQSRAEAGKAREPAIVSQSASNQSLCSAAVGE